MNRTLIIVLSVFTLLIAAALIGPSFVDWNQYKTQAQEQVYKQTGHSLNLNGDLGLAVLPYPYIYAENVSIDAPPGSAVPHLAKFKRVDVSLEVAPLLQGKIAVSDVNLLEPDIALQVFEDGRQNWMTPQLEAMNAKQGEGNPAPGQGTAGPDISLDSLYIENGRFAYRAAGAQAMEVTNLNADINAQSLKGPFGVDGKLDFGGQTYELDLETGAIDAQAGTITLKGDVTAQPYDIALTYNGVVATVAPFDAQGQVDVRVGGKSSLLQQSGINLDDVAFKGLLSANQERASIKDFTLALKDNELRGDFAAQFSPMAVRANLAAQNPVNIDDIFPAGKNTAASDKNAGDPLKGPFIPETVSLPQGFSVEASLSAPAVFFRSEAYKDVRLRISQSAKQADITAQIAEIPGKGKLDVTAGLRFASQSLSEKDGAVISADPTLSIDIDARTPNMPMTLAALLQNQDLGALSQWKSGSIDAQVTVKPYSVAMTGGKLSLGDTNFVMKGSFVPGAARSKVIIDATADNLNFDEIQEKLGGQEPVQKSNDGLEETLKSLALPYDVQFDVGVQSARLQGYNVSGLRAQGMVKENALQLSNLSAQNVAGAAFRADGGISDIRNLSGITANVSAQSGNIPASLKAFGIDAAGLPDSLKSGSMSASASGNASAMDVKANMNALDGSFTASGKVSTPLTQASLDGLALQVKHPNFDALLAALAPSSPRYSTWRKPVDFSAELSMQDKKTSLNNIRGNLAGTTLSGSIAIDSSTEKPDVTGALTIGDVVMKTAASGQSSTGAASQGGASAGASAGGKRWSGAPLDVSWMNGFNANLDLKANSIVYNNWNLQKPALKFALKDGALVISDLSSGLFGGNMSMSANVKAPATVGQPVSVNAKTNFENVAMEEMVLALVNSRILQASGTLNMDAEINGAGGSQNALVNSLAGQGTMNGTDIVLEGFDVSRFAAALSDETKPGDSVMGIWKGTTKGGSTAFDTLDGNFTMAKGIATINKMDLDGPKASLAMRGTVSLSAWYLDTQNTITVKDRDIPPFTVKLAGPLDNPAQTFGQGVLQDYLQRKISRKIEKEIGDKLGDKLGIPGLFGGAQQPQPQDTAPSGGEETQGGEQQQQTPPPPPAATPEDAIRGVLDGLLNRQQ